jgi:hypothetical protein
VGDRGRGDHAAHAAVQLHRQRCARLLPSSACCAGRVQATSACRPLDITKPSHGLMINEDDVEKLASAAGVLAPSTSVYLEEDFVMNLLETVLDYMLQTEVVVKALKHFRENRWNEVRKLDDLEQLMARFPEDQTGNTVLAQHLWGTTIWTRAQQLRELARYFRRIGVVDQERLGRGSGCRGEACRGDRGRRPQRPCPARGGEADRGGRRACRAGLRTSPNQACWRHTSAITAAGVTVACVGRSTATSSIRRNFRDGRPHGGGRRRL